MRWQCWQSYFTRESSAGSLSSWRPIPVRSTVSFAWRCAKPARRIGHPFGMASVFSRFLRCRYTRLHPIFATPQVIVMTVGILLLLVMLAEKKRRDGLFGGAALALAVLIAYLPRKDVNMAEDETVHAVVDRVRGRALREDGGGGPGGVSRADAALSVDSRCRFFRSLIREIFGGRRR